MCRESWQLELGKRTHILWGSFIFETLSAKTEVTSSLSWQKFVLHLPPSDLLLATSVILGAARSGDDVHQGKDMSDMSLLDDGQPNLDACTPLT